MEMLILSLLILCLTGLEIPALLAHWRMRSMPLFELLGLWRFAALYSSPLILGAQAVYAF
jgi:hypothetical protein